MKKSLKHEIENILKDNRLNCSINKFEELLETDEFLSYDLSCQGDLSEDFLMKYGSYLLQFGEPDFYRDYTLSKDFIYKYKDELNWPYLISEHGIPFEEIGYYVYHISYYSCWKQVIDSMQLPEDFILRYFILFNDDERKYLLKKEGYISDALKNIIKKNNKKLVKEYFQSIRAGVITSSIFLVKKFKNIMRNYMKKSNSIKEDKILELENKIQEWKYRSSINLLNHAVYIEEIYFIENGESMCCEKCYKKKSTESVKKAMALEKILEDLTGFEKKKLQYFRQLFNELNNYRKDKETKVIKPKIEMLSVPVEENLKEA